MEIQIYKSCETITMIFQANTSNDSSHMCAMSIAILPRVVSKSWEPCWADTAAAWEMKVLCWLARAI
jgi:hypothetical protein